MDISIVLNKVFNAGQLYWQQADSEYVSQNKKSDTTLQNFNALRDEAVAYFYGLQERAVAAESELETLRAKHKELMEQEPIGYVGAKDIADLALDKINAQSIFGAPQEQWEVQTPVYAKPIAVQPSPAVTVPAAAKELVRQIAEWELPKTGKFYDEEKTRPMSYGACYGSNGERDYFRNIALDALSLLSTPTPPSAEQVQLPTTLEQAELMQKVGYAYLQQHAPERLVEQPDSAAPELNKKQLQEIFQELARTDTRIDLNFYSQQGEYLHWNTAIAFYWFCKAVEHFKFQPSPATKPQRIAEQDVLDIIEKYNYWKEHESFRDFSVAQFFREDASKNLLAKLSEHREPDKAPNEIPNEWRVTRFGQIKVGDVLSLVCGDSHICTTAKEILNAGTNREEVIYNRKKNHYFITGMVLDGTSTHKHVFIVPNPAIAQCEGKGDANGN